MDHHRSGPKLNDDPPSERVLKMKSLITTAIVLPSWIEVRIRELHRYVDSRGKGDVSGIGNIRGAR